MVAVVRQRVFAEALRRGAWGLVAARHNRRDELSFVRVFSSPSAAEAPLDVP